MFGQVLVFKAAAEKAAKEKAAQEKAYQENLKKLQQQQQQQKLLEQQNKKQIEQQKAQEKALQLRQQLNQQQQQQQQPPPPVQILPQQGQPGLQSDIRLKRDVTHLATLASGIKLYSFRYLWSDETYVGVMAQDLLNDPVRREAVILQADGFYAVDYARLGLRMATFAEWQARGLASVELDAAHGSVAPVPVAHTQRDIYLDR